MREVLAKRPSERKEEEGKEEEKGNCVGGVG